MAGISIGGIIGIVLFVFACKNILKTYKEKSGFIKFSICVGLFIVAMMLSVLFLFLLNPDASAEKIGENSIIFTGLFANIISLILVFFHVKKHNTKTSKKYKSSRNELIITTLEFSVLPLSFVTQLFKKVSERKYKKKINKFFGIVNKSFRSGAKGIFIFYGVIALLKIIVSIISPETTFLESVALIFTTFFSFAGILGTLILWILVSIIIFVVRLLEIMDILAKS